MGDADSAIKYYKESAEFLSKLSKKDLEVVFFSSGYNPKYVLADYLTLHITW